MIAVFDTNIVIDALNGVVEADAEFLRYDRVIISRISWIEVLVGEGDEDYKSRDFMDSRFDVAPVDVNVAEKAIELRRKHGIRLPDAIIWATAQVNSAVLVSRNTRDFKPEWAGIHMPYQSANLGKNRDG